MTGQETSSRVFHPHAERAAAAAPRVAMLLSTLVTASSPAPADRHASDHASGAMSFDEAEGYQPARMRVLWLENTLDCRTWSYYCDIRDAMKKYHTLCTPSEQ